MYCTVLVVGNAKQGLHAGLMAGVATLSSNAGQAISATYSLQQI